MLQCLATAGMGSHVRAFTSPLYVPLLGDGWHWPPCPCYELAGLGHDPPCTLRVFDACRQNILKDEVRDLATTDFHEIPQISRNYTKNFLQRLGVIDHEVPSLN